MYHSNASTQQATTQNQITMNAFIVLSALFLFTAAVWAGHEEDNGPASYKFDYGVYDPHTGDKKEQYEHRDGHHVKGGYSLKEADGTLRVVEYVASPHGGFNAVVKRIGHAQHPAHYGGHHGGHHGGAAAAGGGAYSHVGVTHYGYHY